MAINSNYKAAPSAGAGGGSPYLPQEKLDCLRCEGRLVLGIFFDGTSNNRDIHLPSKAHSNVARLYAAYPNDLSAGYGRVYIPGVGTPMAEVSDLGGSLGSGFSSGGEARILYGVLSVFNAVDNWLRGETRVTPGKFLTDKQVTALCSHSELVVTRTSSGMEVKSISDADLATLKSLDATAGDDPLEMQKKGGLLHDWPGRNKWRSAFFEALTSRIVDRIRLTPTPTLKEIVIDVFGFSRGAAQARAFCNHLYGLADGNKLFGVTFTIRFLGIFDTVASVGIQSGALGYTTGHMAWADPDVAGGVSINSHIHRCEHYIAMHENRGSFPLDRATNPKVRSLGNGNEWAYPGSHSDVGGGYAPRELGKSLEDKNKLSQIPLNHMYKAAKDAGVPLDRARVPTPGSTGGEGGDGYDSFEVGAEVQAAFSAFRATSPSTGTTQDYLLPYIAWQFRVLDSYPTMAFYKTASRSEAALIDDTQKKFRGDIARVKGETQSKWYDYASPLWATLKNLTESARQYLWIDEDMWEKIRTFRTIHAAENALFENYVHDSLAGFAKDFSEPTGRLHWRRIFYGSETAALAHHDAGPSPAGSELA